MFLDWLRRIAAARAPFFTATIPNGPAPAPPAPPPAPPWPPKPERFDDIIDAWHRNEIPGPLHLALGMTHAQYRAWVENPASYRAHAALLSDLVKQEAEMFGILGKQVTDTDLDFICERRGFTPEHRAGLVGLLERAGLRNVG